MDKPKFEKKIGNLRKILNGQDWTPDGENVKQGYKYLTHTKIKGNVSRALVEADLGFQIDYSDLQIQPSIGQMSQHYIVKANCKLYDIEDSSQFREYIVYGEAGDSGDKGMSKVHTNAFKNFWANNFMLSFYTDSQEEIDEIKTSVMSEGGSGYQAKKEIAKERVLKNNPVNVPKETTEERRVLSPNQKSVMEKIMNKATTLTESDYATLGFTLNDVGEAYNKALGSDDSSLGAEFILKFKKVMTLQ